jgi:hypothetical protein
MKRISELSFVCDSDLGWSQEQYALYIGCYVRSHFEHSTWRQIGEDPFDGRLVEETDVHVRIKNTARFFRVTRAYVERALRYSAATDNTPEKTAADFMDGSKDQRDDAVRADSQRVLHSHMSREKVWQALNYRKDDSLVPAIPPINLKEENGDRIIECLADVSQNLQGLKGFPPIPSMMTSSFGENVEFSEKAHAKLREAKKGVEERGIRMTSAILTALKQSLLKDARLRGIQIGLEWAKKMFDWLDTLGDIYTKYQSLSESLAFFRSACRSLQQTYASLEIPGPLYTFGNQISQPKILQSHVGKQVIVVITHSNKEHMQKISGQKLHPGQTLMCTVTESDDRKSFCLKIKNSAAHIAFVKGATCWYSVYTVGHPGHYRPLSGDFPIETPASEPVYRQPSKSNTKPPQRKVKTPPSDRPTKSTRKEAKVGQPTRVTRKADPITGPNQKTRRTEDSPRDRAAEQIGWGRDTGISVISASDLPGMYKADAGKPTLPPLFLNTEHAPADRSSRSFRNPQNAANALKAVILDFDGSPLTRANILELIVMLQNWQARNGQPIYGVIQTWIGVLNRAKKRNFKPCELIKNINT